MSLDSERMRGHRPSTGDGETAWRVFALSLQARIKEARVTRAEALKRAVTAERRANKAEARVPALRARGDDFHELLQREETALRHERRVLAEVERLLVAGDPAGALELIVERRRKLTKLGVLP